MSREQWVSFWLGLGLLVGVWVAGFASGRIYQSDRPAEARGKP